MVAIETEKETKYKIAWNQQTENETFESLVSLKVNTWQLETLAKILTDNNIKGFGVTVIK